MEEACFTLNRTDIDSSLLGLKRSTSRLSSAEPAATYVNNNLRFLPKNQKKFSAFYNEFTEARNQFILSESPAKLFFQRDDHRDIFYHLFNREEFEAWTNRSPVAILFLEEGHEVPFEGFMSFLAEYEAVAIVQARGSTFRFCVRTRDAKFQEAKQESTAQHLRALSQFIQYFKKSGNRNRECGQFRYLL